LTHSSGSFWHYLLESTNNQKTAGTKPDRGGEKAEREKKRVDRRSIKGARIRIIKKKIGTFKA